ncbi:hypothetical protein E4U17_003794 [Claviceps sp. LM77 group G4]|nr:hypothetical protein E4U17_003794 [Claviceps sp. LM77 group G4]KAG6071218.1 hypothetical protein E4U33_003830 [Claviceps sp. LM78 group G4]KAG6074375.1 hypothetical protein E4U16_003995 [Claviceps sp. LM84 group G4]
MMGYSRPLGETATAITGSLSIDETDAPQAHGPDPHQDLLALANKTVLESQVLIAEIELLLRELSTRSKKLASTGVPMFLRSLQTSHALARQGLDDLSPSPSPSSLPDEASLRKARRKIDTSAVDVSRAATHWAILKRCSSLVAIHQAFQGSAKTTRGEEISRMPSMSARQRELMHRTLKQQAKVEVHVVASGSEWVHVRTLQADRLARQMSDAGWNWGQHDADEFPEKEEDVVVLDEDEWSDVPLAKQVKRLIAAAKLHRHEYRIPRLRIVLPNIGDEHPDIHLFLGHLSRMDPAVHVTVEVQTGEFLSRGPPAAVEDAIRNLVGCPLEGLTETLNLDHSILVALASDMTHLRVVLEREHSAATRAQIEEEARHEGGLMAKVLYPILQGRKLVCTPEAAEHFHHVLRLVGTASECERGELLVPLPLGSQAQISPCKEGRLSREAFRARFRELSVHEMPSAVDLPVTVMAECWRPDSLQGDVDKGALPGVALDVVRHCGFSAAKLSVFMYGWRSGNVTLSCNREVKAQFRTLVEMYRRGEDDYGPLIWGVDVARNLLGRGAGEAGLVADGHIADGG